MKKYMDLLGLEARDVVTGYTGVITTVSFDLYGCVQVVVTPKYKEGKDDIVGRWFDSKRLTVLSKKPVMEVPSFTSVPGGAEYPSFPDKLR